HRLDDLDDQRLGGAVLELRDQFAEPGHAGLARDRQQAALDQILLFGRQDEAGPLLQELAQIVVVLRCHGRSPENKRTTFWAIWSSGSTAEQIPALAAAPGIPHTTLVASSCAITLPPVVTISVPPRVPSEPIPVRIRARIAEFQNLTAELNSGSTA